MINLRRLFSMVIKSVGLVDRGAIGETFTETKRAIAFVTYPLAPRSLDWDGDAAIRRVRVWAGARSESDIEGMDFTKYRNAFAWFDEKDPEALGSYKLPHHDVIGGELATIFRGTSAALAALSGARGGVDIPAADRPQVQAHLDMHLEEFEGDEEGSRDKNQEGLRMNEEQVKALLAPLGKRLDGIEKILDEVKKATGNEEGKTALAEVSETVKEMKSTIEKIEASSKANDENLDQIIEDSEKRFEQVEGAVETLGRGTSSKIAADDDDDKGKDGNKKGKEKGSKFPTIARAVGGQG